MVCLFVGLILLVFAGSEVFQATHARPSIAWESGVLLPPSVVA